LNSVDVEEEFYHSFEVVPIHSFELDLDKMFLGDTDNLGFDNFFIFFSVSCHISF